MCAAAELAEEASAAGRGDQHAQAGAPVLGGSPAPGAQACEGPLRSSPRPARSLHRSAGRQHGDMEGASLRRCIGIRMIFFEGLPCGDLSRKHSAHDVHVPRTLKSFT